MAYTLLCVLMMFVRVGCSSPDRSRLAYYDFIILDMLAMHHLYPAFISHSAILNRIFHLQV
jgi:hypothetical protein